MEKGYVQVYTGNGKGKTTAAVGLAIRAAGAAKKVYFGQFVKDMTYSEIKLIRERIPEITTELLGNGCFIDRGPNEQDRQSALTGLQHVKSLMLSSQYDIIILDEIFIAHYYHLLSTSDILDFLQTKPETVEVILTGRYAPPEICECADLVTEMVEEKHYYQKGVLARDGIER